MRTWEDYKNHVKSIDAETRRSMEEIEEIAAIVQEHGHQSILTRQDHQSGSDRIFEALQFIDPAQTFNIVINLQGDLPFIEAEHLRQVVRPLLAFPSVDIATLCSPINTIEQVKDPNIVKLIGSPCPKQPNILSALYFTRAQAPYGAGPFFEHIGVYAYQRQALQRFVHFPPSALEQREKLEQLRALENGMTIKATLVENCPISVDTAGDLEKARLFWHAQQKHTSCS